MLQVYLYVHVLLYCKNMHEPCLMKMLPQVFGPYGVVRDVTLPHSALRKRGRVIY